MAVEKSALEEALFHFLVSVCAGRPQGRLPVVVEPATLNAALANPHVGLQEALRHCVDAFLIELAPGTERWQKIVATTATLALALAAHNCLAWVQSSWADDETSPGELLENFNLRLLAGVPPARDLDSALVYHAVLRNMPATLTDLGLAKNASANALLAKSPLTSLWAIDEYFPEPLHITAEALMHWRRKSKSETGQTGWRDANDWLDVVTLLITNPGLAAWLRQRWLAMPETRPACRNLGVLLEALRQKGQQRDFILSFYESYDYFGGRAQNSEQRARHKWPILEKIKKLLEVSGDSEAAMQLNRWGNEYFLKFKPLLKIAIAEKVWPKNDYALMSWEFYHALRPLLDYIEEEAAATMAFRAVEFQTS